MKKWRFCMLRSCHITKGEKKYLLPVQPRNIQSCRHRKDPVLSGVNGGNQDIIYCPKLWTMREKKWHLSTKESIIQFGHGLGSSEVALLYPTLRWNWSLCSACGSVTSHECWIRFGDWGCQVKALEQFQGVSMKPHHSIGGPSMSRCDEWYNFATSH